MAGEPVRMRGTGAWGVERGDETAEAYTEDDVTVGPAGAEWRVAEIGGEGSAVVGSGSLAVRGYLSGVGGAKAAMARRRVVRSAPKPGAGRREATLDAVDACPVCRGDGWPDCESCWGRGWVWREGHGDSGG